MTMLLAAADTGVAGGGGTANMTVGSGAIGGKGFSSFAYGYGNGISYGTFGTLTPNVYSGHNILGLYQADSDGTTIFEVDGDASALTPTLTVDGVDQLLGVGSFGGGVTYFQSTGAVADPFVGKSTVAVSIS
jgi:hypothetical protein